MMIANYMAPHEDEADGFLSGYPGQDIIAEEAEMSLRSARDHIRGLVERGLLQKKMRFRHGGVRTSDWYRIPVKADGSVHQFPALEDASATKEWPALVVEEEEEPEDDHRQNPPPADLAGGEPASDHRQPVAGYKGVDQLDTNLKKNTSYSSTSEIASRSTDLVPRRDDVESLCTLLADRIEANGSKRPNITDRWRDAARLMIDRDGRDVVRVQAAILWCQNHEFWKANVLSMPKLREKYDQLRLVAQREQAEKASQGSPNGRNGDLGTDAHYARYLERAASREADDLPTNLWDRMLAMGSTS
jgi:hypothetical protein